MSIRIREAAPEEPGLVYRMMREEQAYPGDTDRWYILSKRLIAEAGTKPEKEMIG
ncbi:hypothetical protein [Paenibacillus ehimensis]|uniref:GNAT family N-acetyltransferase n=1 Tax=Paenibacillus ehimensis TaxID=79264 RepID=A0ABT8V828_9BACL|nr:hypothetical protein [Paenibacillus ehimensis]MDO3676427.1 hypothetical protein [Paenibacillus ehimensis]MEC0208448.1 hypothetical protein [Paenibacillus ehimensis]